MTLLLKCIISCCIISGIHLISKTSNYYISGLILSFPGLSILAYYFMYLEQGPDKVRDTLALAALSTIPFAVFLLSLSRLLKRHGIVPSLILAAVIWACLAVTILLLWKRYFH